MADNKKNSLRLLTAVLILCGVAALAPGCGRDAPGRFVVVVVMDGVRRDAPGCYGREGDPTPAMDGVAGDGVRFDRAIAASGSTLPSVTSLLTSTWPTIHGVLNPGPAVTRLRPHVATAAETMRSAGYLTAAFSGGALDGPGVGLDRGFDVFEHGSRNDAGARQDKDIVDAAVDFAASHRGQDCFVFVYLSAVHAGNDSSGDDIDRARGTYQRAVSAMDAQVDRLVDAMKAAGVYERGFVVVTSGRGEEFGERGDMQGHTLYDASVGVPLVIKFPSDLHPTVRTVGWQVALIDVMPTVLDYLAIDTSESSGGESLLSFVRGEPRGHRNVFSEGAGPDGRRVGWRTASYVYLQNIEAGDDAIGELYNWRVDPHEQENLADVRPEIAAQMRAECVAFYAGLQERAREMTEPPTREIDAEDADSGQ